MSGSDYLQEIYVIEPVLKRGDSNVHIIKIIIGVFIIQERVIFE